MKKDFFEIGSATVKAKVLNVHCNGTHPFLLCLVKEFSYKTFSEGKKGKVIFDDYSCKMGFYVESERYGDFPDCEAEYKAKTLVNGDIVEFTIHRRDPYHCIFTSFTIVETSQICLAGFSDLQQLANKLGKDDE